MVKLLYFLRTAIGGLRTRPLLHAVAVLTVAAALFFGGLARFATLALESALQAWGRDVEVTLYLRDGVPDAAAEALAARLRADDGAQVRRVSADEALARLRADLGSAGEVLAQLPQNPLPASLEIQPRPADRGAGTLAALAARWSQAPEVASVDYGREAVERLEQLATAARSLGGVLLAVVLAIAAVVVAATLQLAIYARRDEIEIQKLVGATDAFVKAPFVLEGIVQGLAGAGLAALGLQALARGVGPALARATGFLLPEGGVPPLLDVRTGVGLAVAGSLLGLVGSLLAVRRFVRV